MDEGMAVRPRGRRRGRGAHMGEEEMRRDVAAQMLEVLVRPGGPDLAIEAGLELPVVPAEPEAVALRRAERLLGGDALAHQRMLRLGDVARERNGAAPI